MTDFAKKASGFDLFKDYAASLTGMIQQEALEVVHNGMERITGKTYTFKASDGVKTTVVDLGTMMETQNGSISVARCVDTKEVYALKRIVCGPGARNGGHVTLKELEDAEFERTFHAQLPHHPNIVTCYGATSENEVRDHVTLLLLDYCDGGTLTDFLEGKAAGEVAESDVLEVLLHTSRALHHLHSQALPVEHRAVNSGNIVWCSKSEHWKLCDFGSVASKVLPADEDVDLEATEQELREELCSLLSDVRDSPPEAASNSNLPFLPMAVDVWMLGCLLFRMLFARKPFATAAPEEYGAENLDVPTWAGMTPAGGKLCILLHWMLSRDPRNRPSAGKVAGLFERWSISKPRDVISACPDAVRDQVRNTLRSVERRVTLDWVLAKTRKEEGGLRTDTLGALNDLGDIPLVELRKILPEALAKKVARLRWSYGMPGLSFEEEAKAQPCDIGSALSEIDDVLKDLETEVASADNSAFAELQDADNATIDLLGLDCDDVDGGGGEDLLGMNTAGWGRGDASQMASADQQYHAQWLKTMPEGNAEKLQALSLVFMPPSGDKKA